MLVSVELEKCTACGACVLEAPEVFDQDDEGIVVVLTKTPSKDLRESVEDAADACPSAVIQVHDE
ncbi:ferredoxin [Rhodococcus sp. USK13]|uniref:ferredoxin n=1 Tax=Rhodococcus sp. USK13 TaxID=2806442 RepID=UPI001BCD59FA|nr:ferredoxin [Rhodococcus sp. USK13]